MIEQRSVDIKSDRYFQLIKDKRTGEIVEFEDTTLTEHNFISKIKNIVRMATALKNKHTDEKNAPVNYACIFSQSKEEYNELIEAARKIGKIIKETPTGPLFHIKPLQTVSGVLKLLKIRMPDPTRPELGDADFTISNFPEFEKKYLHKPGFKLIKREGYVMIELLDPESDVRVYFSNPTLDVQMGIE